MQEGYTITNKFIRPTETVDLTVNKVWVDNETQAKRRPESIVVNLKAENRRRKNSRRYNRYSNIRYSNTK